MKVRLTAKRIASLLINQLFERAIVVCPNSYYTGYEADMLCIDARTKKLIDIEIKIERSDLKADFSKDKWHYSQWVDGKRVEFTRAHPPNIWKHYYVMPGYIWKDELLDTIPPASGAILIDHYSYNNGVERARIIRRAKTNRLAKPLEDSKIFDLARLVNLRYWDKMTPKMRKIGRLVISADFVKSVVEGQSPDPGLLAALSKCVVFDVKHNMIDNTVVYTMWHEGFDAICDGEEPPLYKILVEGDAVKFERVV